MKKISRVLALCMCVCLVVGLAPSIAHGATKKKTVTSSEEKDDAPSIKLSTSYTVKLSDEGTTYVKFKLSKKSYVKFSVSTGATGKLSASMLSDSAILIGFSVNLSGYIDKEYANRTFNSKDSKVKLPAGTYYLAFQSTDGNEGHKGKIEAPTKATVKVSVVK